MRHRRYGHLNHQSLCQLRNKDMVIGLTLDASKPSFCEACAEGKSSRTKFPERTNKRRAGIFELVHSDICGKISPKSLGGSEYFITFIDDHSRYVWVYFMKRKDEAFEKFCEWKLLVEKQYGEKVKTLRTDNGGEYTSSKLKAFLKSEGIRHELTVPKNPEQNGVAERMNRTLVEMTRSNLFNQRRDFWGEALSTAVYIRNRSPTSVIPDQTPFEALTGSKPDVSHLRSFGCSCYAHIPKDERKKMQPKARKCLFFGYGDCVKGYRVYDMERKIVFFSRDVRFDEEAIAHFESESRKTELSDDDDYQVPFDDSEHEVTAPVPAPVPAPPPMPGPVPVIGHAAEPPPVPLVEPHPEPATLRRSTRNKKSPDRYGDWLTDFAELDEYLAVAKDCESPKSYSEVMSHPNKSRWQSAMEDEMKSLKANDVWDLVPRPDARKVIGCKWVFKVKVAADGSVTRHKARLVAQGFSQKPGLDYDETFSPVVRSETVRTVFAICAQEGLLMHQMDVATAFLNGNLEEDVFMEQPEGYRENNLVCKLKRSLYGLKQSPRCWNVVLDEHLQSIGFKQHQEDPCLYTATGGETVIVAVYVDDILVATQTKKKMDEIKGMIAKRFNVKDMGELQSFLGIQVKRDSDGLFISQPGYTMKVLEKFGMEKCNPVATPVNVSVKLQKDDGDEPVSKTLYQSAVGSLLYLSGWTRPDIAYAVSNVAKFASLPSKQHWIAVKHILRYIKGTLNHGIKYKKGDGMLVGYSDASWASDINDRKSVSGYVCTLSGAPISWRSKKQTTVALSTAEAEYIALAAAAQEVVWLRHLMRGLGMSTPPTVIHEDNQSAIAIAKNPQFHGRTKHVDIKYHFVRELVNNGSILLGYCASVDMLADLLTKGLAAPQHRKLSTHLSIVELC